MGLEEAQLRPPEPEPKPELEVVTPTPEARHVPFEPELYRELDGLPGEQENPKKKKPDPPTYH